MARVCLLLTLLLAAILTSMGSALASPLPPTISDGTSGDAFGIFANGRSGSQSSDQIQGPAVQSRVDDCGTPQALGHVIVTTDDQCAFARNTCAGQPQTTAAGAALTILSSQTLTPPSTTWVQGPVNCSGAGAPAGIDAAAVRDAFVKRVPTPAIRTAPVNSRVLVNVETLLWLDTTDDVDLGTTALLGHQVRLTASVQTVTWDFGDHHTDTTTTPGRPFLSTDYCATLTCPDWYGHTYTTTGTMTLTATITWTGRYTLDNGPSQPITGTVTPPALTTGLRVLESLSVLVPNPTGS